MFRRSQKPIRSERQLLEECVLMAADLVTYCGDAYLPLFEITAQRLAEERGKALKKDALRDKAIALSQWRQAIKDREQSAQVSSVYAPVEDRRHNQSVHASDPSRFSLPFLESPKPITDPQKRV